MAPFLESLLFAVRGSLSRAGAWASLPGGLFLWAILYMTGWEMVIPDRLPGAAAVFLLCASTVWLVIFIARLLYAPYHFLKHARNELQQANSALTVLQSDRA